MWAEERAVHKNAPTCTLFSLCSYELEPQTHTNIELAQTKELQFSKNWILIALTRSKQHTSVERLAALLWQVESRSGFIVALPERCINTSNCLSLPPLFSTLYFSLLLVMKCTAQEKGKPICVKPFRKTRWDFKVIHTRRRDASGQPLRFNKRGG